MIILGVVAVIILVLLCVLIARVTYLYSYYTLHQANVPDSSSLPPHKQHEVVGEKVQFLRGTGTHGGGIQEPGWARQMVFDYKRSQAKLWAPLVKEWDYYGCLDDEIGVCLTIADMGYAGTISASVLEGFNRGPGKVVEFTDTLLEPLSFGKWHLPNHPSQGSCHGRVGNAEMTFSVDGEEEEGGVRYRIRTLIVDWPNFGEKAPEEYRERVGVGLKAKLTLRERIGNDTIAVATPFGTNDHLWYLNQKINCQTVSGNAVAGKIEHEFHPEKSFAVLDWGRGLWPYTSSWVWASASGMAEKRDGAKVSFGLNFGHGFGNCATHTENCVFVDGKISKFGRFKIEFDKDNFKEGKWHYTDEEDLVDITLEPYYDRYAPIEVGPLSMVTHQVFGAFSGTVKTESGDVITVRNVLGWSEFVCNSW